MHEISSYACKAVHYGAFKTAMSQLDLVINESGVISNKSYHLFMDLFRLTKANVLAQKWIKNGFVTPSGCKKNTSILHSWPFKSINY